MSGLFGDLFDFNHDGKLDGFEQTAEFATFAIMMDTEEAKEKADAFEMSGLDLDELDMMEEDERREALEDAGLDPDDYEEF